MEHSNAGRLSSQDAILAIPPHLNRARTHPEASSPLSRSHPSTLSLSSTPYASVSRIQTTNSKIHDPHALLSLPEFIREAVPEPIQQKMSISDMENPNKMLSLPEFVREPIPEQLVRHARAGSYSLSFSQSSHGDAPMYRSNSESVVDDDDLAGDLNGQGRVEKSVSKKSRNRSLSAPPLAWLLSGGSSGSRSGSSSPVSRQQQQQAGTGGRKKRGEKGKNASTRSSSSNGTGNGPLLRGECQLIESGSWLV